MVQSCSENILKRKIPVICESEYPLKSYRFLAKNNLLEPPKKEEVRHDFLDEIEKTLKMFLGMVQ